MDAETADSVLLDEMVYLIARDNEAEGFIQEMCIRDRHKNLPMVRWLIEQGADITIADKYGDRPYTCLLYTSRCV